MQPGPSQGFEQIATEILRGIVAAVADQPNQSPERRAEAQSAAICMTMAFGPRDPVELMMAGHCLVYDAILRDGARDLVRGQADDLKLRGRPGILAAGKMFLATVRELNRMQGRTADKLAFPAQPAVRPEPAPEAVDLAAAEPPAQTQEPAVTAEAAPAPDQPRAADLAVAGMTPMMTSDEVFAAMIAHPGVMSPEECETILLGGLPPELQQEIRESVRPKTERDPAARRPPAEGQSNERIALAGT